MKNATKKISRILIFVMILTLLPLSLSSCEYKGKEIVSIEKTSSDYMGGSTSGQKLYLKTGEVHTSYYSYYMPEESYDYKLDYSYDPAISPQIVNEFYRIGLFNLKDNYKPLSPVMDGGGWTLTITYADGTTKKSTGSNAGPYLIFQKAGEAFYDITGGDFIRTPSDEYKYAPSISFYTKYSDTNTTHVNGFGIAAYRGTWRGREMPQREDTVKCISLLQGYEYVAEVSTQNYEKQFASAKVYAYGDDITDKREVETKLETRISLNGLEQTISFVIEPNTNYLICIEFKLGNAEYLITTIPPQQK